MDTHKILSQVRRTLVTARDRAIGRRSAADMRERGMTHGERLHIGPGAYIDDDFAWLIELGDDVTMAPNVSLIAHDASTKMHTGYTRIAPVRIGNRVFLGTGTIVLPGVTIGDDVVVGAGSVVTKDIPAGSLAVGSPAKVVGTVDDYLASREAMRQQVTTYPVSPWHDPSLDAEQVATIRREMGSTGAFCP